MITLDIPVKPYVKKYLEKKFGKNLVLSLKSEIWDHLYVLLINNKTAHIYDSFVDDYPDKISVQVPFKYAFFFGARNLTSISIVRFNTFIENLIKREFILQMEYIESHNRVINAILESKQKKLGERSLRRAGVYKKKKNNCIVEFMNKYEFTDADIKFDTLKKIFYRFEQKVKFS